jgi:hypothetical protein
VEASLPAESVRVTAWDVVVDIQTGLPDVVVVSTSALGADGVGLRWVDQLRAFPDDRGHRRASISVPEAGFELLKDATWSVVVALPIGASLVKATDDPAPEVTEVAGRTIISWSGVQDPDLDWIWDTSGGR